MKKSAYKNLCTRVICILFVVFFTNCENELQPNDGTDNSNVHEFLSGLNIDQQRVVANNPYFITYLRQHDASQPSREFILQLVAVVLKNGGNFSFDNRANVNNSLVFWNVANFGQFLDTIDENGVDFGLEQSQLHTTAKFKVHVLGLFGGIAISIKQESMPYSICKITSECYGFASAFNWNQIVFHHSIGSDITTIMLWGKITYNCVLKGTGMVWSTIKLYRIRIDKNTGSVISAMKIN